MIHKLYDVVRVVAINNQQLLESNVFDLRPPRIGDVATILDVYDDPAGYELECSDETGVTLWLIGCTEKDVELESL